MESDRLGHTSECYFSIEVQQKRGGGGELGPCSTQDVLFISNS